MRSWNWLYRAAVPVALIAVEASWFWPWLAATAHLGHARPDLPYLALALLAVALALVSALSGLVPGPRWLVNSARIVLVLAGTMLGAGLLASLFFHAPFGASALVPWSIKGGLASSGTALAWFVASLCAVRAAWITWKELSFSHIAGSLLTAAVGYVVFFIVDAARHSPGFRTELTPAIVLLLCSFPVALAVVGLVHGRQLERDSLRAERSAPGLANLAALLAPMALLSAVALLVALVIGPLGPLIVSALEALGRLIGHELSAFASWLSHEVHAAPHRVVRTPPSTGIGIPKKVLAQGRPPVWIWIVAVAIGVAIALGVLVLLVRLAIALLRHTRLGVRKAPAVIEDERESVFTWSHVLDQLLAWLRRARGRRPGSASPLALEVTYEEHEGAQPSSLRMCYRILLAGARSQGLGRARSETALELAHRLSGQDDERHIAAPLDELTELYQRDRYGGLEASPGALVQAQRDLALVLAGLASGDERCLSSLPGDADSPSPTLLS